MSKAKTVLEVRILSGGRAGEQQLFFDANEVRIGRHPTADVLIPDAVASRQHAVIARQTDDSYLLSDQGSTAGMYDLSTGQRINQIPIPATGTVEVSLGPRHILRFGDGNTGLWLTEPASLPNDYRLSI